MAKLGDKRGEAEINFVDYNYGYISYSLRLLYSGKSLINPELLAEEPFHFDEYDKDSLIPFFENLLQNDRNAVFNPVEPEIRIEAYFSGKLGLKEAEKQENYFYSDDFKKTLQVVDEERGKAGGKLPDDCFNFYFSVNEQKLKPWREATGAYGSFVPMMEIIASRKELEDFVVQLKSDYEDWKIRNKEQIEYYGPRNYGGKRLVEDDKSENSELQDGVKDVI